MRKETWEKIEKEFDEKFNFPDIYYWQKTWCGKKLEKKEMVKIKKEIIREKLKSFICQLLSQQEKEILEEIEKWLKEADITKPSSSVIAILYRKLKKGRPKIKK